MTELEKIVSYWETPEALVEAIHGLARNNVIGRLIAEEEQRLNVDAYILLCGQFEEQKQTIESCQRELEEAQAEQKEAELEKEKATAIFEAGMGEDEQMVRSLAYDAGEARQASVDATIRLMHRTVVLKRAQERMGEIQIALKMLGGKVTTYGRI